MNDSRSEKGKQAHSRVRRVALAVTALVVLQAAAVGVYFGIQRARSGSKAGSFRVERMRDNARSPNIVLERADGNRVNLHEIPGAYRLVHFWATWCPPCVEELPGLMETSHALARQGLTLVAISMDDEWSKIRAFFGGDVPAEVFRAVEPDAHETFDIFTLPDTYLVGPDDALLFRYGGARSWRAPSALEHLKTVLQ